jgi:hypothetical protein
MQRSDEEHSQTMAEENRRLRQLVAELLRSNERLRQQLHGEEIAHQAPRRATLPHTHDRR